jgi:membrane protein DedA with SNARE-associated domain
MLEAVWELLSGFKEGWYPVLLAATALVETLFPPFPGDVIYIALAGLALRSGVPVFLLWLPGFVGCFISTVMLDSMGRSSRLEKLEKVITGARGGGSMVRARKLLARRGPWIISMSRFIPGIRSILVVAAASSGMPRRSVLAYAGASAALWYGVMVAAGRIAGAGIESAEAFMSEFSSWLWGLLAGAVVIGGAVLLVKVRREGK